MASKCTVVVVGDARVGKTALIRRLHQDLFVEEYTPTGFDQIHVTQEVNDRVVDFVLWDTSGSPSYDSVRSLPYSDADVFLLCYNVGDPSSLYDLKFRWAPEIRAHRVDAPLVICGCRSDARFDAFTVNNLAKSGRSCVNPEQALALCCELGAINCVETCASTRDARNNDVLQLCFFAANVTRSRFGDTRSNLGSGSNKEKVLVSSPVSDVYPSRHVNFSSGTRRSLEEERCLARAPVRSRCSVAVANPGHMGNASRLGRNASFRNNVKFGNNSNNVVDRFGESLKSQGSTGSTVSKASSSNDPNNRFVKEYNINKDDCSTNNLDVGLLRDNDLEIGLKRDDSDKYHNKESFNQGLAPKLNFVSPKTGVYRPVQSMTLPAATRPPSKRSCSIM